MSQDGVPSPFEILQHQLADVHLRWRFWKQLFVSEDNENFNLMNVHAASFFWVVEQAMFDDVVLRLCRLADPAEAKGKTPRPNLTLATAYEEAKPRLGAAAAQVQTLMEELKDILGPLRSVRNRLIAHLDRATAMKAERLADIHFATVEKALDTATQIMQQLEPPDRAFFYQETIAQGDGNDLLRALRRAEHYFRNTHTGERP